MKKKINLRGSAILVVLFSAIASVIVGLIIFLPKILIYIY